MLNTNREAFLVAGAAGLFAVLAVAVVMDITTGWWSGDDGSRTSLEPIDDGTGVGVDAPAPDGTLAGSLFLVTATPAAEGSPTSPPTTEPSATPVPATATPTPPADATISVSPGGASPAQGASSDTVSFAGVWRVTDTVTEGASAGQTFSFDITLSQEGNRVVGGNSGIQVSGTVQGNLASLAFVQPQLGLHGDFVWTMVSPDRAGGAFTSSAPNSGTSILVRLQ